MVDVILTCQAINTQNITDNGFRVYANNRSTGSTLWPQNCIQPYCMNGQGSGRKKGRCGTLVPGTGHLVPGYCQVLVCQLIPLPARQSPKNQKSKKPISFAPLPRDTGHAPRTSRSFPSRLLSKRSSIDMDQISGAHCIF